MQLIYENVAELTQEYQEFLQEAKASGKKLIGYFAHEFIPEELIASVNAIPVPLIFAGDEDRTSVGAGYLTPTMCPLALSQIGAFQAAKESGEFRWLNQLDGMIVSNYCTAAQLVAEMICDQYNVPRFDFHIPYLQNSEHIHFYQSELQELGKILGEFTNNPLEFEPFNQKFQEYSQMRLILSQLNGSTLKATDQLKIVQRAMLFGPSGLPLNELASFVKSLSRKDVDAATSMKKVIFTGCAPFIGDDILQFIEDCGAEIVWNDTWLGPLGLYSNFSNEELDNQSIESIDGLLECIALTLKSAITSPHCSPNYLDSYIRKIVQISQKTQSTAVINHILKFCDIIGHHRQEIKDKLNKRGIQVLNLERDYSRSITGQLRTRVEAFLEMI